MEDLKRDIVVVGASTGGIAALQKIFQQLPKTWNAACMVVLHIAATSKNMTANILQNVSKLPVLSAKDRMPVQHGQIYIAPPDHHLVVEDSHIRVWHGPKENGHRPAVDTLFRSAAREYGPRVIGVVLTGALDCGTIGLLEIKKYGGLAVIQNSDEAEDSSMPNSALEHVEIDHIAKLAEMGPLLTRLTTGRVPETDRLRATPPSPQIVPSTFVCPECGGPLWEDRRGKFLHYECRTGHQYSSDSLLAEHTENIDRALWHALEVLREKAKIARQMAKRAPLFKYIKSPIDYEKEAQDADNSAAIIEKILMGGQTPKSERYKRTA